MLMWRPLIATNKSFLLSVWSSLWAAGSTRLLLIPANCQCVFPVFILCESTNNLKRRPPFSLRNRNLGICHHFQTCRPNNQKNNLENNQQFQDIAVLLVSKHLLEVENWDAVLVCWLLLAGLTGSEQPQVSQLETFLFLRPLNSPLHVLRLLRPRLITPAGGFSGCVPFFHIITSLSSCKLGPN